jgi:hypothetical protein
VESFPARRRPVRDTIRALDRSSLANGFVARQCDLIEGSPQLIRCNSAWMIDASKRRLMPSDGLV